MLLPRRCNSNAMEVQQYPVEVQQSAMEVQQINAMEVQHFLLIGPSRAPPGGANQTG